MTNMLLFLFDGIADTVITAVVILVVALLVIAMIKSPHLKPLVYTIFAVAWIFTGVYSITTYISYQNTTSVVNGEPVIYEPYKDFNYLEYDLKNIVWYAEDDGYSYEETYQTSAKFEGAEKKYSVIVNDMPASYCNSANGRLVATYEKIFKDIDGEVSAEITFNIQIVFQSSSITVTVTCNATQDNIGMVREYTNLNGFNIRIINTVYTV